MDKEAILRKANINKFYAISLTPEKKRLLLQRIYETTHRGDTFSDEQVHDICNELNQCFEARFESISLAMNIIIKLLSDGMATAETIRSYRKLLSYVSATLNVNHCAGLANYLSRISTIALKDDSLTADSFPVTVMKCILVLMYRLPIITLSERKVLLHTLRSTLDWCKRDSKMYKQCGINTLIRTAVASAKHLSDDLSLATELTVLAHHILDVFFSPQTMKTHPIEVLLRWIYEEIFTRLVPEWANASCFELLLYVLYNMLKRDIYTYLKLDIIRLLADAAGGGTRRLVRLLCTPKHLRDGVLLHKVQTILTIVLTHSLFRYEPQKRAKHFQAFLKTIEQMICALDLFELLNAKFLCFNISRTKLSLEHVCFVFAVRHLELMDGMISPSLELDYVYNLTASVNIAYYKRWKIPNFLVKHFIDGLTRFSNGETFTKNVTEPDRKLEAILSTIPYNGAPVNTTADQMFGRLPVTTYRIQWLQLRTDHFRGKLIFHQQLEILQEYTIVSGADHLATSLLAMFNTETLVAVLSAKRATLKARQNASVLLSKCSLTGPSLTKVLGHIKRSCRDRQQRTSHRWVNWVRAVYGSVHTLDNASRRSLWCELSAIELPSCSSEQRLLLVDTRASLLVDMVSGMKGAVAELHFHHSASVDKGAVMLPKKNPCLI